MKEYIKPEVDIVVFTSEAITDDVPGTGGGVISGGDPGWD